MVLQERPKPFLKWAGGKTQLVPQILARFPDQFRTYYEPFVGGGAVFFALGPKRSVLSDINEELVATYQTIRDDVDGVIRVLKAHRAEEEHFYKVRAQQPGRLAAHSAAARTIFLNRTCFNGLYRVNRRGRFNVPFGRYRNPTVCNEVNLRRCAQALSHTDIVVRDALKSNLPVRKGDLVYVDPPYDPISDTANFTAYTRQGFGKQEQRQLAEMCRQWAERGVHVVASNSNTRFIRSLYKGFRIEEVYARRAINSRADRRGPVIELLISST